MILLITWRTLVEAILVLVGGFSLKVVFFRLMIQFFMGILQTMMSEVWRIEMKMILCHQQLWYSICIEHINLLVLKVDHLVLVIQRHI